MHFWSLATRGLFAIGVSVSQGRRVRRQEGPTDPGIASDCTYWVTATEEHHDCSFFETFWDLEHEQFVDYVSTHCPILAKAQLT